MSTSILGLAQLGVAVIGSGSSGKDFGPPSDSNLFFPIRNLDTLNCDPICGSRICVIGRSDGYLRPRDTDYKGISQYNLDSFIIDMDLGSWKTVRHDATSECYITVGVGDVSMVRWEQFYEFVLPSVQGCPVSIVESAIKSATIEFCGRSLIWRQDSIPTTILEGESLYRYAPPYEAKVVMPYYVSIYGKPLKALDLRTLDTYDPEWREKISSLPDAYVQVFDDTIQLVGTPTEDLEDAMLAGVVLKPSRNAEQCPNFLYDDWAEYIAAGALAKLHAMSNKIWAVPSLAEYYNRKFREGMSKAASKAEKSWQRETKSMIAKDFYRPRGLGNPF